MPHPFGSAGLKTCLLYLQVISGGPLQVNNEGAVACTQLLVAIHAADEPTKTVLLTTRLYGVLAWIESIVWP